MEDMKAWKSLEAYNQLTSGWFSDVAVFVEKVCEERFGGFGKLGGEWRTTARDRGVVKSGGYGSEGEVHTQYRCQPQPDFKEESNNVRNV